MMESHPSSFSLEPLQEMALNKVAVSLWSNPNMLASIEKFNPIPLSHIAAKEWRDSIECEISKQVSKLPLPELLMKQVLHIVKPIGVQIRRWKRFHEQYLSGSVEKFEVSVLAKLHWTSAGRINYRKTAEELVRCKVVDNVKRYKLACLYCLDDWIPVLWKGLPKNIKTKFYKKEDTSQIEWPYMEMCWPYILKGKESKLDCLSARLSENRLTFNKLTFQLSACSGNKTAAEYFYRRITQEERAASLIETAQVVIDKTYCGPERYRDFPKEELADVVCYLLSLMEPKQQMQIFVKHPVKLLLCFLDWPWQQLLVEIAKVMWDFIPTEGYRILLLQMINRFTNLDYYFPEVFQEFFRCSPLIFRSVFVNEVCSPCLRNVFKRCVLCDFLEQIFENQDSETIRIFFRNIDAADRVRLVSSEHFLKFFEDVLFRGCCGFVDVCLRESTQSKEDALILNKAFIQFVTKTYEEQLKWRKCKWERFFQFLEKFIGKISL